MKGLMEALMDKKEEMPMDEKSMEAKKETLMELIEMMSKLAGEEVSEGMQKVTVAAPDKESLMEGLDKAEEVVEEAPEMEDMMPEDEEMMDDEEGMMDEDEEEDEDKKMMKM